MKKLIITESQFQRLVKNLAEKRSKLNESVLNEDSEQGGGKNINYKFKVKQTLGSAVTEVDAETRQTVEKNLSKLVSFIKNIDTPVIDIQVVGFESKVPNPKEYEEIGSLSLERAKKMASIVDNVLKNNLEPFQYEVIAGGLNFEDSAQNNSSIKWESGGQLGPDWDESKGKDHPDYTAAQYVEITVTGREFYYESLASKMLKNDVDNQLKAFGEGKGGNITWKGKNWTYNKFIPVKAYHDGLISKESTFALNKHLTEVLKPTAAGATGNQTVKKAFADAFGSGKAYEGYKLDMQWMPSEVQDDYMRTGLNHPEGMVTWADRNLRNKQA